jgi:hypothetical protein
MAIDRQDVSVDTQSEDEQGCLLFSEGKLVAVLVRLANHVHGSDRGAWYLEAGFGRCATILPPLFATVDEAEVWVRRQVAPAAAAGG